MLTTSFGTRTRRRFTLAHELCHLIHDRGYGARLAIASGPWAPADVEQRANAFAAMLLDARMHLVAQAVKSLAQSVTREEEVWSGGEPSAYQFHSDPRPPLQSRLRGRHHARHDAGAH